MFELTNNQRQCFALAPVCSHWELLEARPSPYDQFKTYLYLDGDTVVKCILSGDTLYSEYELSETVSQDRKLLLPKTPKGKAVPLSSSAIQKRRGVGMKLYYSDRNVQLYNEITERTYYSNTYSQNCIYDLFGFSQWVDRWCQETTIDHMIDLQLFARQSRKHIRYNEGDVFRFKLDRRLYGYGRILLDYDRMRKQKETFWDILMGKPLICSVYHIVTERIDVSLDELKVLPSIPSTIIADNALYYGEYEIIGNLPVTEQEDYPVMYGNSISSGEKAVYFQCGREFHKLENRTAVCSGFRNNGVSFSLNVTLDILQQCIREKSNDPYWQQYYSHWVDRDLRNPKYTAQFEKIKNQFVL